MARESRRGCRSLWLVGLGMGMVGCLASLHHQPAFIRAPPVLPSCRGVGARRERSPGAWGVVGIRSSPSRLAAATVPSGEGTPVEVKRPWTAGLVSWIARQIVYRNTRDVVGMRIDVGAKSNRDVIAGNLPVIKAEFREMILDSLQITGGGNMVITGLDVKLLALILARRLNVIRRPFEIFFDYVLTQQDVMASRLIRDLIQLLVNTILRAIFPNTSQQGLFDVAIQSVEIRNGKLAINFTANVAPGVYDSAPSFTLLTGVGLSGEGHVIYLDQPELLLNPRSKVPVKVPLGTIRVFDVDIGDNARIERIQIDDQVGVRITARTLITPAPPFQVSDVGKRAAFLYDLGAFLSFSWGFTQLEHYEPDWGAEI